MNLKEPSAPSGSLNWATWLGLGLGLGVGVGVGIGLGLGRDVVQRLVDGGVEGEATLVRPLPLREGRDRDLELSEQLQLVRARAGARALGLGLWARALGLGARGECSRDRDWTLGIWTLGIWTLGLGLPSPIPNLMEPFHHRRPYPNPSLARCRLGLGLAWVYRGP